MKKFRKWNRILHRDIGYFFFGVSIIYALSGIALNHLNDWNPNYVVTLKKFTTKYNLHKAENIKENILILLDDIDNRLNYKQHYYPNKNTLKIFLKGGSSVIVDVDSGEGEGEFLRKRPLFYQVNFLHYNPNNWWTWFSDIFCGALIFLSISGMIILKGKKGFFWRGAIIGITGIIIPLIFLILS